MLSQIQSPLTATRRALPFGGLMGGARLGLERGGVGQTHTNNPEIKRQDMPAHEVPSQFIKAAQVPFQPLFQPFMATALAAPLRQTTQPTADAFQLAHAKLVSLMPSTTVLAYSTTLAKLLKSPKASLYLSQLVYWTRVGVDVVATRGWIHKTRDEWSNETGLSRYEQESARKRLLSLGLMQEQRTGSPARLWFRVDLPVLAQWLAQAIAHGTLGLGYARSAAGVPVGLDVPSAAGFNHNESYARWQYQLRLNDKAAMSALLGSTQPFHLAVARMSDTHSAVLLSRMMWMQTQSLKDDAKWFSYSTRSFESDLGMSRSQVTTAMKQLHARQWIGSKTLPHPRLGKQSYYQLNAEAISSQLLTQLQTTAASNTDNAAPAADGLLGLLMRQTQTHSINTGPNTAVTGQSFKLNPAKPASLGLNPRGVAQILPTRFYDSLNLVGGKSATQTGGFKQGNGGKSATLKITLENTVLKTTKPTTTCIDNSKGGKQHALGGGGFGQTVTPPPLADKFVKVDTPRPLADKFVKVDTPRPLADKFVKVDTPRPLADKFVKVDTPRPLADKFVKADTPRTDLLHYPSLKPEVQAAVEQHIARLAGLPNYLELAQAVLDELDGFMNPRYTHAFGGAGRFHGVASPVGWVRRVVGTALAGEFIPERAPVVAARRLSESLRIAEIEGNQDVKVADEFIKFEPSQLSDSARAGYEAIRAKLKSKAVGLNN